MKNFVFISGANGKIGKKLILLINEINNVKIIKLPIRFENTKKNVEDYFKKFIFAKKTNYFFVHLAYNWKDKRKPSQNLNYVGSIKFFRCFLKVFPNGSIINISTTVAVKENKSSYAKVKLKLQNWIVDNRQFNLISGVFVDYPSFGQMKLLEKITLLPVIFLPLSQNIIYLSSISVLAYTIKMIITEKIKFKNFNILCACQPVEIKELIKKICVKKNIRKTKVINFPFEIALIIFKSIDFIFQITRFEEKLIGLQKSKILDKEEYDQSQKHHFETLVSNELDNYNVSK